MVIFALNLYNYKITQKPENKQKITNALKDAGVDEDTVNALDDTVNTMNNGVLAVNRAKELLSDAASGELIDKVNSVDPNAEDKSIGTDIEKNADQIVDTAKNIANDEQFRKEVADEVMTEVKNRAEELPSLSDDDIDDIVDRVAEKVKSTCSDENIRYYLQNKDLNEFNNKLANEVTQDKYGFISSFMKKWINNMPNINSIDPLKKSD